jgi:hypothetical protein
VSVYGRTSTGRAGRPPPKELLARSISPKKTDVDGKYGRWLDTLGARVVLIRPDFHVFGTASGDVGSTNLLVADLLRRVTHPND